MEFSPALVLLSCLAVGLASPVVYQDRHILPEAQNLFRVSACEWEYANLTCPRHQYIAIKSAQYGKLRQEKCPRTRMSTETCWADVSAVAKENCQGAECTLSVNNDALRVDPCAGITKYLEVSYRCGKVVKKSVGCEKSALQLSCPSGNVEIISANYGRQNKETCPRKDEMPSRVCWFDVAAVLENMCSGSKCDVKADNRELSVDPCLGIHKYMDIEFSCQSTPAKYTRPSVEEQIREILQVEEEISADTPVDDEATENAAEEAKRIEEENEKRAAEEAKKLEEERKQAEEEAKKAAEEERKAEEEENRKEAEEAKKLAEEEAKREAEEIAKLKAEEEAKRKEEEEAMRKAIEDAKREAEEEAKRQEEEEAKKEAEEEAKHTPQDQQQEEQEGPRQGLDHTQSTSTSNQPEK